MEVRVSSLADGAMEIAPLGALDELSVGELRRHLLDRDAHRVLLDLSGVTKIDASGIALLMLARIEIEAGGGVFVVQGARPSVRRMLEGAGLDRFVTVADRRVDALVAVRRPHGIAA